MALPFLPGNSFNRNIGKEKFHKSHYLQLKNEEAYMYGDDRPGIGGEMLPGQRIEAPTSIYPSGIGSRLPTWLAFDKQALSFDAYFQESVNERREEQYRIRKCKILFYPEDDTIQVIEPRIANTGMSQGTIIKRHRIPKPAPNNHLYYTVHDFNVGTEFTAYGKTFRIVACDPFTSNFLRKLGVKLGEPEPIPDDPYSIHRKAFAESMQPLRPYERLDKLRQFLDHDRHVLRFYCYWDDTESLYGDPREMILNYFLADDTIEIREIIPANSGRDAVPCFLRRQKLPRTVAPIPLPGVVTDRTLLNVFGHPQRGGHYVLDSLKLGAPKDDFYKDNDLTIGANINVYGRKFLIYDCDEFTKEYYRIKYGLKDFTPVKPTIQDNRIPVKREIPPYNGWGTDEDSLANCNSLIPKVQNHNFKKFMELDRQGLESHVLRFSGRLLSDRQIDHDRQFVISCYLSDDTISIYETQQKNSGFQGGLFLERSKIKKPNNKLFDNKPIEYYKPTDLYVGANLNFNTFQFELIEADEYTLNYMEKHKTLFKQADYQLILNKLKSQLNNEQYNEIIKYAMNQDPDNTGTFDFNQMKSLIDQLTNKDNTLTTHELGTLARYYSIKPSKEIQHEILLGIAQQTLRRKAFEDFSSLIAACSQQDSEKTGEIDRHAIRRICLAHHLPLPDDMLNSLMDCSINQNNLIQYEQFINQLNWRNHTNTGTSFNQVQFDDYTGNIEIDWLPICQGDAPKSLGLLKTTTKVDRINYKQLIKDLCGEDVFHSLSTD
ncbi:EF-hand domain-containing family member C2 [Schistosoma japonicum]|uniref:EF-hand domain-containing family member C2 n=1 Tax=Schistosoma japonicum TaxID=6182 RepID=A0A4Z2DTI7_SCHJA|nr:EF-hand domain-containing family member C2 [Schistosoma japonicum]